MTRTRWKRQTNKKWFLSNQGKRRKGRLYWMLNEEREQQTKTRGSPKINTESSWGGVMGWTVCMHVCFCIYVHLVSLGVRDKSRVPSFPLRNISKIATTNQTKCKSALWKDLKKKSFEGPRKNRYSFQPIYSSRSIEMGHSTPATLELLKQDSRFYFLE